MLNILMLIFRKIAYVIFTFLNKIKFKLNKVKCGKNIKVNGIVRIVNAKGNIILGNNIRINSAEWANPIGFSNKTTFQTIEGGSIIIGEYTGISNASFTSASKIYIGRNVLIGAGVKIYDTDFHPLKSCYRYGGIQEQEKVKTKAIEIKDNAFIGAGTIVLKGSLIGKNSIIGAGSVVSGYIPDNEIWAGNPAKFIKKLDV